jgi:hypothetical protein
MPAAEMIVDSAPGHVVERDLDGHQQLLVVGPGGHPQHQLHRHARGKLVGVRAEAARLHVEKLGQMPGHAVDQRRLNDRFVGWISLGPPVEMGLNAVALLQQLGAVVAPELVNAVAHVQEVFLRQIGASVDRTAIGHQPDRHRPTPLTPIHHGGDLHVDLVHVGPFLAIDFDEDKAVVDGPGDRFALESLVLHHVAPVTGGIPDAQEDGLVFLDRTGEGLLAPFVPVDGVVRVLEQVGAGRVDQAIGVRVVFRIWVHGPGLFRLLSGRSGGWRTLVVGKYPGGYATNHRGPAYEAARKPARCKHPSRDCKGADNRDPRAKPEGPFESNTMLHGSTVPATPG